MNIPEEFGKYLLLKKLSEDSLGETFRAGRAGRDGIDQVVLLRVFNGQSIDGERLWQRISNRGAIQQALRSPNIGSGVDLGKVRSFPYSAYDYISGKNLGTLLAESARQHLPVPPDHALLLVERLALALAAAYETRVHDERVLHGLVVPQLVMISNEGEARLLGFEFASGLRELMVAGWRPQELVPYLAPEAYTGPPAKSDDVYSLGALLYELLTGQPLPSGSPEQQAAVIDGAVAAHDDAPFPPPVAALLKKSLVAREERIGDAVTWHKAISKLMIDGQYSSTTFNLAFFMHNLFRDDIERETQEIQAEKRLELPQRVMAATAATVVAPVAEMRPEAREVTGVRETTFPGSMSQAAGGAGKSKAGLWIGIAAGALLVIGAGAYFGFVRGGAKAAPPVPAVASGPAVSAALTAVEAKKQADAIQAQMQQMIEARSKEMESKLRAQYDDQLKELQKRYDESRKAAVAASQGEERQRADRQAAVTPSAPPDTGRTATQTPSSAATETATPPAAVPAAAEKTAPAPLPAEKPAVPVPEPSRTPQVQVGDLVTGGPGVVAPKIITMPKPRYPTAARRMNNPSAAVILKVLVDEHGHVQEADPAGAPAGFGFDEAAVEAARRASYQPATKDGVPVRMWVNLRVAFNPAG